MRITHELLLQLGFSDNEDWTYSYALPQPYGWLSHKTLTIHPWEKTGKYAVLVGDSYLPALLETEQQLVMLMSAIGVNI